MDNEVPVEAIESKKPVEVTAEDLADEEWGPVKEKKKDKKGKSKKGKQLQDEGEEEEEKGTLAITCHSSIYAHTSLLAVADVTPAVTATSGAKDEVDDEEEVEEPGVKVLSKKEKEKLKKEREKV